MSVLQILSLMLLTLGLSFFFGVMIYLHKKCSQSE